MISRALRSQAALTVAALALDAQLHRDPTVGKVLVKVRPGSAPCPWLGIYEQVCRRVCRGTRGAMLQAQAVHMLRMRHVQGLLPTRV